MQEIWVQSLSQEDPLPGEGNATPVFLPGKCPGERNLVGYSPCGYLKIFHYEEELRNGIYGVEVEFLTMGMLKYVFKLMGVIQCRGRKYCTREKMYLLKVGSLRK